MTSLQDRLTLQSLGRDVFRGWAAAVPPRVYGGETAAQAVAAADRTVAADRSAHTVQCTYLRPGDPSVPIEYRVERERDGRSFSTRVVVVKQGGVVIQRATVGYHVEEVGAAHQLPMPQVPDPERLPGMRTFPENSGQAWGDWVTSIDGFDIRPVSPDRSDEWGRRQHWSRFDLGVGSLSEAVFVTYASDMTMLASVRLPHEPTREKSFQTTTLTHSVYFHHRHEPSKWLLWDHYSPVAAGARGLAIAHAYDQSGRLVASAVQEGLARPPVGPGQCNRAMR